VDVRLPDSVHVPVLLREVLEQLDLRPGLIVVDGTVGAGGHSAKISERIGPDGVLIGLDRDRMMLEFASRRVSGSGRHLVQSSYVDLPEVLTGLGIGQVDRILLDLGLSSDQLADRRRGFGFSIDAPLDMRFDAGSGESLKDLLARIDVASLERILTEWGEERFSGPIAQAIVDRRRVHPLETTRDLVEAVEAAIPAKVQKQARREPATRVFQALRIAVNDELKHLERALETTLPQVLTPGGRMAIITFHSLEDRLVKTAFRNEDRWEMTTRKPVDPTPAEIRINPRSRSARLRTAVKR